MIGASIIFSNAIKPCPSGFIAIAHWGAANPSTTAHAKPIKT
jgi:hypothetical protein